VIPDTLIKIKREYSCGILSECSLPDITAKQISYLETIDQNRETAFIMLAEINQNSKSTITGMISKLISSPC
jgi:DNA-binding MarR family transcriptional regulator